MNAPKAVSTPESGPALSLRARLLRPAVRWLLAPALDASRPVALRRARLLQAARLSRLPLPVCTRIEPATFRGVPGDWLRNARTPARRTVLYFHGGAYAVGSPRIYREFCAHLAHRWQAQVAAIDYRLAPEHRFPAAADDALSAYHALLESGVAATDIVVAGDSAGGALALACVLQARGAGLPLPARLVLFSPWVDLTLSGASARRGRDDMLDAAQLRASAADYLGGRPPTEPLASPLFADLHGLPPVQIHVTDTEILYDDARRLLGALHAAGTAAELRSAPGLWHVWPLFAGKLPEADAALLAAVRFIETGPQA